jgi:hypothetical protein
MANELATTTRRALIPRWTKPQIELLKRTVAKGTTDDEFSLFQYACKRTGLDPFIKQIYAIKRWDSSANGFVMGIQTGIDGYRLTADRTGKYAGSESPDFQLDPENPARPLKATVVVYKFVEGENCQTKDGAPIGRWKDMPFNQLAKCAEAQALRKAFPADLSGIYVHEEMPVIDIEPAQDTSGQPSGQDAPKQVETKSGEYYTGVLKDWTPKSQTVKTHKFTFLLDNNGGALTLSSFDTPPALKAEKNPIGRRVQLKYEAKPNPRGGAPFLNLTHLAFEELTPEADPEPEQKKPAAKDPITGETLPTPGEYLDLLESCPTEAMLVDVWGQISKELLRRNDISKADKATLSKDYDDLLDKLKKA